MTSEELEQAVTMLLDRQAIHDCVLTYSRGVDRMDRDLLVSVYHEDAVDDHGVFIGTAEEFADWALELHRTKHLSHQHCLFNHTVDIDGDVAHAETYYLFLGINREGPPVSWGAGRYIDRLERREGRWAIAARKCLRDWSPLAERPERLDQLSLTAGKAFLPAREHAFLRTCDQAARDRTDPSYERPLTIDEGRLLEWALEACSHIPGAPAPAAADHS